MSTKSSMPSERRTKSAETPVETCSSGESWLCVVLAGWMARLFASPMLARCEKSRSASMNFLPPSNQPFTTKPSRPPKPPLRYFFAAAWLGLVLRPG